MVSITVNTPARVAAPHGASLAAALFTRALGWFQSRHQQRLSEHGVNTRASEAARVRRFAEQVMNDDPRFAADLFAAADRHERS